MEPVQHPQCLLGLVLGEQHPGQRAAAGAAHGSTYDPGHANDFGLPRVLDGLAALIDSR